MFSEWVDFIKWEALAGPVLMGIAALFGVWSLLKLATQRRVLLEKNDEWRDPPPALYLLFKPLIRLIAPEIGTILGEESKKKITKRLSAAGMNYAILPQELVALRFLCMLAGGLISYSLYVSDPTYGPEILTFIMMIPPAGYLYPDLWLSDQITKRRGRVNKEFPFLLDLLVLSMRAGLNYSGSLAQAINALPEGPVRDEFGKVLREIRSGKSRRDALLDLGDRMNIESVNNFVAAINQAEETGGEIVDVLSTQAKQRRTERFNTAEEMANRAPVKMLLPMMAFLFPIIFMLMTFILLVKLGEIGYLPDGLKSLLRRW